MCHCSISVQFASIYSCADSESLCCTPLPCRACCINHVCVGWDWEINHRTRWCRGFMSPSPIPSPCGIPLIFSSVQIRVCSSSFECYCYHSASKSNSSRVIWSYFRMQDLAGGWWFCGRNTNELEMEIFRPDRMIMSDPNSGAESRRTFVSLD